MSRASGAAPVPGWLDRAVIFGFLGIATRLVTGPLTLLLVASHFSQVTQGFYYAFTGFLGFQVLVELGLGQLILQFAAHEWPHLELDSEGRLRGEPGALARLVSVGRFAFAWYGVGALLFLLICGGVGVVFFGRSQAAQTGENWFWPWVCLCVVASLRIFLTAVWSILEGCNQVTQVYRFRWFEALLMALSGWVSIVRGGGLWTLPVSLGSSTLWALLFLTVGYSRFLSAFLQEPSGPGVDWRKEIWPVQWRIAVSFMVGSVNSTFTAIVFQYWGAEQAGQFGMTWTLAGNLGLIGNLWANSKAPLFGALIAKKDYEALDRLFYRATLIGVLVVLAGGLGLELATYVLYATGHRLSHRMLPPLPTLILVLCFLLVQMQAPMGLYLRAHKQEPLMTVSVVCAVLTGLSAWALGRSYGAMGVILGFTGVRLIGVPWSALIWLRCRREWHAPAATVSRSDEQSAEDGRSAAERPGEPDVAQEDV